MNNIFYYCLQLFKNKVPKFTTQSAYLWTTVETETVLPNGNKYIYSSSFLILRSQLLCSKDTSVHSYIDRKVTFTSNISLMTAMTQTYSSTLLREERARKIWEMLLWNFSACLAGCFQCCLKCLVFVECVGDENIVLLSILPNVVPKQYMSFMTCHSNRPWQWNNKWH